MKTHELPGINPVTYHTISDQQLQSLLAAAAAAAVATYKAEIECQRTEERHPSQPLRDGALSIEQAAKESGWSRRTVTRLFENEPDVLIINRPETLHNRAHRSIRIPRKVYDRVMRKLAN